EREAPGAIEPAAEGGMDDQLHAARLVEETLEHDGVLRRQGAQSAVSRAEIIVQLARCRFGETERAGQPARCRFARRVRVEVRGYLRAQARYGLGELVAAARGFAEPERNRRRLAMCVFDANRAALDSHDAIGMIAELEDVAGETLDCEILVHRADEMVF